MKSYVNVNKKSTNIDVSMFRNSPCSEQIRHILLKTAPNMLALVIIRFIHVYQLLEITTSGPGTMYVADADVKKTYPGIVSCEIHVPNA